MKTYQPINCEFHDVLESYATTRKMVDILLQDPVDINRTIRTVVCDIFSRNGEEFLVTDKGEEIRLDKVKSLDSFDIASFS